MDRIGYFGHEVFTYISWAIEYLYLKVLIHAGTMAGWISPFNRLATVLYEIHGFLVELDGRVIDLRGVYDTIVDRLNAILDLDGLEYLLTRIFSEWRRFREDPRLYISDKIGEMLHTWSNLRDDARGWVMDRIYEYNPYAWEFLRDPVGKLMQWLREDYPIFHTLLTDPAQGVRDALDSVNHDAYLLVTDPVGYLRNWFVDTLGWSGEFWVDPWRFLFTEILDSIERRIADWRPELTRKGERIVRYLWEGRS